MLQYEVYGFHFWTEFKKNLFNLVKQEYLP